MLTTQVGTLRFSPPEAPAIERGRRGGNGDSDGCLRAGDGGDAGNGGSRGSEDVGKHLFPRKALKI